jgi:hypothetical protein
MGLPRPQQGQSVQLAGPARQDQHKSNLHNKNIITVSDCPVCPGVAEDRMHLFFGCPAAIAIWRRARINLNLRSFDDLWEHHPLSLPSALVWPSIALLTLSMIWDSRNTKIFRNKSWGASTTLKQVIDDLSIWLYCFEHKDQKVAAISWRDHLTHRNSVN